VVSGLLCWRAGAHVLQLGPQAASTPEESCDRIATSCRLESLESFLGAAIGKWSSDATADALKGLVQGIVERRTTPKSGYRPGSALRTPTLSISRRLYPLPPQPPQHSQPPPQPTLDHAAFARSDLSSRSIFSIDIRNAESAVTRRMSSDMVKTSSSDAIVPSARNRGQEFRRSPSFITSIASLRLFRFQGTMAGSTFKTTAGLFRYHARPAPFPRVSHSQIRGRAAVRDKYEQGMCPQDCDCAPSFREKAAASDSMGKILLKGVEDAQSLGWICFHCLAKRRNHASKFPIASRHCSRSFVVRFWAERKSGI